jgi:sec-independent protein translocase protein TatC
VARLRQIITAPFRWIGRRFRGIPRFFKSRGQAIREFFSDVPEDRPIGDTFQQALERPIELLPHLDALRKHLLRAVLFLVATTAFSFVFSEQILAWLAIPLEGGIESLMAIEVTEPLSTLMRISLLAGFALALPYLAFEVWLFIAPALHPRARLWGLLAIPAVLIFFLGGLAFSYFVILPTAIPFLLGILGLPTQIRPASYISFTTGIMFWIGISFEFPLIIFLLASLGWISYKTLIQQWRLAVVIIAVLAALITPTIDPVNMSLVMLPLVLLYILSIGLAYLANTRQENATTTTES